MSDNKRETLIDKEQRKDYIEGEMKLDPFDTEYGRIDAEVLVEFIEFMVNEPNNLKDKEYEINNDLITEYNLKKEILNPKSILRLALAEKNNVIPDILKNLKMLSTIYKFGSDRYLALTVYNDRKNAHKKDTFTDGIKDLVKLYHYIEDIIPKIFLITNRIFEKKKNFNNNSKNLNSILNNEDIETLNSEYEILNEITDYFQSTPEEIKNKKFKLINSGVIYQIHENIKYYLKKIIEEESKLIKKIGENIKNNIDQAKKLLELKKFFEETDEDINNYMLDANQLLNKIVQYSDDKYDNLFIDIIKNQHLDVINKSFEYFNYNVNELINNMNNEIFIKFLVNIKDNTPLENFKQKYQTAKDKLNKKEKIKFEIEKSDLNIQLLKELLDLDINDTREKFKEKYDGLMKIISEESNIDYTYFNRFFISQKSDKYFSNIYNFITNKENDLNDKNLKSLILIILEHEDFTEKSKSINNISNNDNDGIFNFLCKNIYEFYKNYIVNKKLIPIKKVISSGKKSKPEKQKELVAYRGQFNENFDEILDKIKEMFNSLYNEHKEGMNEDSFLKSLFEKSEPVIIENKDPIKFMYGSSYETLCIYLFMKYDIHNKKREEIDDDLEKAKNYFEDLFDNKDFVVGGNSDVFYKMKYLKYKNKYLNLKNKI